MVRACKIDGHHLLFRFNFVLCFAVAAVDEQPPPVLHGLLAFSTSTIVYIPFVSFNIQSFPG